MVSFENTEIAFRSKSASDLNRAYWLFKLVANPTIVKVGKALTTFAFRLNLPVQGLVKATIFRQFCGGTSIQDCRSSIEKLNQFGIGTILDYSVEGKTSDEAFESTCNEIIATIDEAKNNPAIPFAVFKVTGITRFGLLEKVNDENAKLSSEEQQEWNESVARIRRICQAAFEANVPVFIDAEESWIQDGIDRLCLELMHDFNKEKAIVFNTLQMYRHDRLEYLKKMLLYAQQNELKYGIKLVRGAYMEKERERAEKMNYPSPIQPDKASSDRDYNAALAFIVEHIEHFALCAGSHNEASSLLLTQLLHQKGISQQDTRIFFAQLLGMSDHISYNLSDAGFNVAKYVPYGPVKEVLPYLLRRADENTSVAGQTGRELSLIVKERKRRKNSH